MTNYYIEFGVDRGESTEVLLEFFNKELRKWVQRAGTAPDLEDRQIAEMKVKHIREAKLVFADEGSRKRYDFELDNQSSESADDGIDEEVDEAYERNLARLEDFFQDGDYINAFNKAEEMLLADNRTADVYEVLLLSLYNRKEYGQVIERFAKAVDDDGIVDSSIYRVFALACEERKEFSRARKELLRLVEHRPNDFMSNYTIAQLFLNNFDGEYFSEAREYIDFLLEHANLNNADEVIEWDIRYELVNNQISVVVAKIASYLSDSDLSETTAERVRADFTEKLDLYVQSSKKRLVKYMKTFNQWTAIETENNEALCNAFPLWDCILSMEISGHQQSTWEKLVEKYKSIEISQETVNYLTAKAKSYISDCPTYRQNLLFNIETDVSTPALYCGNARDYYPVRHILETINSLFQKCNTRKKHANFERFIYEIDAQHAVVQKIPFRRKTYWILSTASVFVFIFLFVNSIAMIFNTYVFTLNSIQDSFAGSDFADYFVDLNSFGASLIYSFAFLILFIGLLIAFFTVVKGFSERHEWHLNRASYVICKVINTLKHVSIWIIPTGFSVFFIASMFFFIAPFRHFMFNILDNILDTTVNTFLLRLPLWFEEMLSFLGVFEGVVAIQPLAFAVGSLIFMIITWITLHSISKKMKADVPYSKLVGWLVA